MLSYRYHPEAYGEYREAIIYYKSLSSALAVRFYEQVEQSIELMRDQPASWPLVASGIRKCTIRSFPFHIFYCVMNDSIIVLAVAHQKRKPQYWIRRR